MIGIYCGADSSCLSASISAFTMQNSNYDSNYNISHDQSVDIFC